MKYPFIKQHDISDCGAACLAMISSWHSLKLPVSRIREIAGTDRQGTNVYGLVKAAKELGFLAKGVKGGIQNLGTDIPLPAIAHVIQGNLLHYVVIYAIKKDRIIVADPGDKIKAYTFEDFQKIWSGVLVLLVPDMGFRKKDETKGIFRWFLSLIFPHKKLVAEIVVSSILYTLLGILGAFYFKFIIDEVFSAGLERSLHIISVGVVVLTLFKIGLNAIRNHLLLHLSQKIDIALIFSYYQHVLKLPISFFDSRKVGEILSRLTDASKIRVAISSATLSVCIDILMVVGAGIVLYLQSWRLFLVALSLIPFSIVVVWFFTKPYQRMHRKVMLEVAETQSFLVESLEGIHTVKAMNAEGHAVYQTEKKFIKTIKSSFTIEWMGLVRSSISMRKKVMIEGC